MYHRFIEQISEFIFAEDEPEKADIIFIPGNGYSQMAEKAAALYGENYASFVLPSGKYSITVGKFGGVLSGQERYNGNYRTEWDFLKDVLIKNHVPDEVILKEDQATFTWENAKNSRIVTDQNKLVIQKAILCCRNVHARRSLMYYQKSFPEAKIFVSPSVIGNITKENWYTTKDGIDAVNAEISRILYQFSLLV